VLVDRYVNNIAVGIANVQQTLAPSHYILHGDVVLAGAPMIEAIDNPRSTSRPKSTGIEH
jgi:predicted NBD/HSP70 family sugar kinase